MSRAPAEVFHPSEFIREEMEERGWSIGRLSEVSWIPMIELSAIMDGGRITARQAECLGRAFGTSAQYWSNLWMAYKKYAKGQRP